MTTPFATARNRAEQDGIAPTPSAVQEILRPFFDAVTDPSDWRNPIDAHVISTGDSDRVDLTVEAVRWFTATESTVTVDPCRCCAQVQSVGYRAGPAGP